MQFIIDPRILSQFPGLTVGVVVAHEVTNGPSSADIQALLHQMSKQITQTIAKDSYEKHPHIAPWRDAYKKFGASGSKHVSSIENLVRRILKGDQIRSINQLVDLYNIISLKYLLPAGGEDLDTMRGSLRLTYAQADEVPVVLLGEKEAHAPEVGEVIYKDDIGTICRRWNWKEVDRTKLTQDTRHAFIVFEALSPVTKTIVEAAINELAHLIERSCGGTTTVALLDQHCPSITIKKDGAYVALEEKKQIQSAIFPLAALVHTAEQQAHYTDVVPEASQEHYVRLEKMEALRAHGIDPWAAAKEVNAHCADVHTEYKDAIESRVYAVAGRVIALRFHGKTAFAQLKDQTGILQIYLKEDTLKESFETFKSYIDFGDIIWATGQSFKTKTGEITLKVDAWQLLSKCLHPLPEKFHGLADVETKYRQRYLDLISSPESLKRFLTRSYIIRAIRHFFDNHGFVEVETPMLHSIPGGAEAKPFITHYNALDMDVYLRIAPELYLKRLIIGGFDRVYEINRCFRNEGLSTRHNPEFTSVEWYVAHHDYIWMMDFVESLLRTVIQQIGTSMHITYGDYAIDFEKPFTRLSMYDAVKQYLNCGDAALQNDTIDALLNKHGLKSQMPNASFGQKLYLLFDELVEPQLIQPTFITHFPVEISPLAKRSHENPNFVDRFELFIAGMELSNAFNELNDPFDQASRFKEQAHARAQGNEEAHYYDADYILALEHALPPTVGAGIGIDRLVMLFTQTPSIRDVILFPMLKKSRG